MEKRSNKSVIIKAKGGMGNRMLCTASGILYADITGRSPYVDWRDGVYGELGHNSFFDFFRCDTVIITPPAYNTIRPGIWKEHRDTSMTKLISTFDPAGHSSKFIHRKYSIDVGRPDYPEDCVVFWNYSDRINRLRPHLQDQTCPYKGLKRSAILRKLLLERLKLLDGIKHQVDEFQANFWTDHVIGVHVRYTDHKTSLAKYDKHVRRLLRKTQNATIFLATDNPIVTEWFTTRFPRIISTPKWLPEPGTPLHRSNNCPNKTIAGTEALVDMYLLSRCHTLVFPGNSTFSWISSILKAQGQAIDVEFWNPKVALARWIREIIV